MNFVGFGEGRANAYVFQDADVGKAVTSVIEGMTLWPNGCNATKAIRIEPGINGQFYETFKETLVDRLDGLTIGDPMDYWTEIGYQDPETIKFLEDRVAKRVASSADEVLYPETSEVGLNSDSLDIRVPPEDGGAVDEDGEPIQMRPIVIEAKSDDSEFMAEEYPGPVLGIMSVGGRELADSYEAAYGDDIPITMSLYTNDRSWFSSDHRGGLADFITRELDAHLYNVNTATSRMNPWLRHQGIDLVDEMTWVESWDTDPTLWKQGKKTPGFIME
jgi:acyl-CoA reductase-like NAD-dependent aldehyde dehydrogenase